MEKNKRRGQVILYAPLFIWIGVIFFLSSGQGSMTRTSLIIRPILEFLFPSAPEATLLFYHGIIRKFAHVAEYAVLGFLSIRAFSTGRHKYSSMRGFIAAIILAGTVACIDEFIQSLNPARTGSIYDVLLDFASAVLAAGAFLVFRRNRF